MCDRSVMILESFFLLLGGAGVPDRGMIADWENRDQSGFDHNKTHPCLYLQKFLIDKQVLFLCCKQTLQMTRLVPEQ